MCRCLEFAAPTPTPTPTQHSTPTRHQHPQSMQTATQTSTPPAHGNILERRNAYLFVLTRQRECDGGRMGGNGGLKKGRQDTGTTKRKDSMHGTRHTQTLSAAAAAARGGVVIVRRSSFVVRRSSFVVRCSLFVVRRSLFVVRLCVRSFVRSFVRSLFFWFIPRSLFVRRKVHRKPKMTTRK